MNDRVVRVDARFAPEHAAYYLSGLRAHTGAAGLPLSRDGFPSSYSDRQPLAFVLERDGEQRRIYIAAGDEHWLDEAALAWADVYGKVNLLPSEVPTEHEHKVVPIGPSFCPKIWTAPQSARYALVTHRLGGRIAESVKAHYRRYWLLYSRRVDLSHYEPEPSDDRYVFHNAWLWKKHPEVNPPRAEFIRACRELDTVDFEGGFISRRRDDMPEYSDLTTVKYPLTEYLRNTKRSAVVFNNPAVHRCHGWKLAEFLALGKAIVSLPLAREMPAPLRHGEHIHFVDGSRAAIKEAVERLVEDRAYRERLESAARQYYLDHLTPRRVVSRLADISFSALKPVDGP